MSISFLNECHAFMQANNKCLLILLHPPSMYVGIKPLSTKCTHDAADKLFCMYIRLDDHLSQAQVKSRCSRLQDERPQRAAVTLMSIIKRTRVNLERGVLSMNHLDTISIFHLYSKAMM